MTGGVAMKRDWDLLRKQLTNIEEGRNVVADIPEEPTWGDGISGEEYDKAFREYRDVEERILGHLELLVDAGFIQGIQIIRGADGAPYYGLASPRLTMAGHDLLDTMRSSSIWESIKSTAKDKGIELTFDAVKALGAFALKQLAG